MRDRVLDIYLETLFLNVENFDITLDWISYNGDVSSSLSLAYIKTLRLHFFFG